KHRYATASRFLIVNLQMVFNCHVFEFAGLEDFATLLAFHEFGVFVARHNLHTRMFAGYWCLARGLLHWGLLRLG
ncbi:MAG TPA: hypothetical protein VKB56_04925, partial [Terriglobales bacterium]|nr:hypothetical protein [Terriglobales bacterium]